MTNRITDIPRPESRSESDFEAVKTAISTQGQKLVKRIEHMVSSHPAAAIGLAAAAGVALGWWIKRK